MVFIYLSNIADVSAFLFKQGFLSIWFPALIPNNRIIKRI